MASTRERKNISDSQTTNMQILPVPRRTVEKELHSPRRLTGQTRYRERSSHRLQDIRHALRTWRPLSSALGEAGIGEGVKSGFWAHKYMDLTREGSKDGLLT